MSIIAGIISMRLKYELLSLISSIEAIGLINPLILVKEMNNTYTIISGKSRVMALKNLFNNTKDLKYKFAPAFILNYLDRILK